MVTKKPKGLGRGLEALLGPKLGDDAADPTQRDQPSTLALTDLVPGAYQPRTRMDEGALYELAESIRSQGIMQPILVRRLAEADGERRLAEWRAAQGLPEVPRGARPVYEIIAGERRFRAARLAGLETVPVLVRDVPDEAAAAMALIENIQRENLNPLEEAAALQRLIAEFNLTHQQAAEAVGRSRAAVSNLLRLLELADEVKALVEAGKLEMGHARALLALGGNDQIHTARQVVARGLSVRETEKLVKRLVTGAARPPVPPRRIDPDIRRLEEELAERLGAKVALDQGRGGKGRLVISYNSLDELDGILEKIRSGGEE